MNEKQRGMLREIAALVEAFVHQPTREALENILRLLRDLIRDVQVRAGGIEKLDDGTLKAVGYDGIELTGLRMVRAVLERELTGLLGAGPTAAAGIAAVCSEQARAMRMLADNAATPGSGRPYPPAPGDKGVPFTTLAMQGCVIDTGSNQCFLSDQPDARIDLYGFTTSIAHLRNAGVTFLGLTGFAGLSAQELSWLCGAARRIFSNFSMTVPQLCCNVEVSAGQRKLYLRLVLSVDRALFLTCEARTVRRPLPPAATVQQLKESLRRTYRLRDIVEAGAA